MDTSGSFQEHIESLSACIEHLNKQNDVEKRLDEILMMDPYDKNDLYKEVLSTCREPAPDRQGQSCEIEVYRSTDRIQAEKMMEEGLANYDGTKINEAWPPMKEIRRTCTVIFSS